MRKDNERLTFRRLSVEDLNVDSSYQRKLRSIKFLVENFNSLYFGVLVVGRRSDGSFYVVDGQHRFRAAEKVGQKVIPCMVFDSEGSKHEAHVFTQLNNHTKVQAVDKFLANLIAGCSKERAIQNLLKRQGYEIGHGSQWYSLSAAGAVISAYDLGTLSEAIRCIDVAWGQLEVHLGNTAEPILGLAHFFNQEDLDPEVVGRRLTEVTPSQIKSKKRSGFDSGANRYPEYCRAIRLTLRKLGLKC